MSARISKSKLKPSLLKYLRLVESKKQSLIVTDHGRPVARIIPHTGKKQDLLSELAGSVTYYEEPLEPVGEGDWDLS